MATPVLKARYKEYRLESGRFAANFSAPSEYSGSSPSNSCESPLRTPFMSELEEDRHVQNHASLPHRHRRKLKYAKPDSLSSSPQSSACSTSSTLTAAELAGSSPGALHKAFIKAAALEEINSYFNVDMTPPITYTNDLATANFTTLSSTPSFISSGVTAVSTPNHANALRLEGVSSNSVASISISTTATNASHASDDSTQISPPSSSSSLPSSVSSSSASSEHSSYSATHKLDHNASNSTDAPRHGTKRRSVSSATQIEARIKTASLRPLGPVHLEHDYTVARKALSSAVAIAAYELFGFSIPVRNDEIEAKRPGKESIPLLREHPLVRRAARAVDKADKILETALARGETFENTPIPDQLRWGSNHLRPYEWAYLEPENNRKRLRRTRQLVDALQLGEPRTRAQKRNAYVLSEDETNIKKENEESGDLENSTEYNLAFASSSSIAIPVEARSGESDSLPPTLTTLPPSSSLATATTNSSFAQSPEKRKRGRPRKNSPYPSHAPAQKTAVTISSTLPASTSLKTSAAQSESLAASTIPVKRRPGRPRKYPLPIASPSSSPSGGGTASAVTASEPASGQHQMKKRRFNSSL